MVRISFAAILLFVSGCATMQPIPAQDEMVSGANVVVLQTTDDPRVAFENLAAILDANGYELLRVDHGHLTIKARDARNVAETITIRATSRKMELTEIVMGATVGNGLDDIPVRATYGGGRVGRAFIALCDIAAAYPDGRVLYARSQ